MVKKRLKSTKKTMAILLPLLLAFGKSHTLAGQNDLNDPPKTSPRRQTLPADAKKTSMDSLRARVKDYRKHKDVLTHEEFKTLQEKGIINEAQANELIALAEKECNPILYKKSNRVVTPDEYSLNFLWIHKDPLKINGHLFGDKDADLKSKVLNPILSWHRVQPFAHINFWYDGLMLVDSKTALQKTITELTKSHVDLNKIHFRDIRTIQFVRDNPQFFEQKVPVYFRVDYAKVLTADHIMKTEKQIKYTVNIDCDVAAINHAQLFDDFSIKRLDTLGFVFNGAGHVMEENSFIMLANRPNVVNDHAKFMIQGPIARVKDKLINGYPIDAQDVFACYAGFKEHVRKTTKNDDFAGKALIAPKSQFGIFGGLSDDEIKVLTPALDKNITMSAVQEVPPPKAPVPAKKAPAKAKAPAPAKKAPVKAKAPVPAKKAPGNVKTPAPAKKAPAKAKAPVPAKKAPVKAKAPGQVKKSPGVVTPKK